LASSIAPPYWLKPRISNRSKEGRLRIGVVAPSSRFSAETAAKVSEIAAAACPEAELVFHPNSFLTHNHFAGSDEARLEALLEYGNDPAFEAIWFARGGYGACRIAEAAIARLGPRARAKTWLGYSDAGFLLAGLYRAGFPRLAHGPMPQDAVREGGADAVARALAWLVRRDATALEGELVAGPYAAFNLTVLSTLLGTPLEPDLAGHVLLLEEVAEHTYRTDRAMFHLTNSAMAKKLAGIRLGRCCAVPENDPPFGEDEEAVVRFWCDRAGIAFLGRADIGHDSANKVVPFGPL
jgi:muramoyltetrapeptide carboxypeptidase